MTAADLPMVDRLARAVHPAFPEAPGVAAERLALYSSGCFVLPDADSIAGYAISHPWHFGQPPALDSLLRELPRSPDSYYIHDLALLPAARGTGAGGALVQRLLRQAMAQGLSNLSLVAVNGSVGFWQRHGFTAVQDAAMGPKLQSYGNDACFMVRWI